jgi:hypothetical protein
VIRVDTLVVYLTVRRGKVSHKYNLDIMIRYLATIIGRCSVSILLFLLLSILLCCPIISADKNAEIISAEIAPHNITAGGTVSITILLANTGNVTWQKENYGILLHLIDSSSKKILKKRFYPGKVDLKAGKVRKIGIKFRLPENIMGEFYFRGFVYVNNKKIAYFGLSESLKIRITQPSNQAFIITTSQNENTTPPQLKDTIYISTKDIKPITKEFTFGDLDWVLRRYGRNTALALKWKDVSKSQIYLRWQKIESEYENYPSYYYLSIMDTIGYGDYLGYDNDNKVTGAGFKIGHWEKFSGWCLDYVYESGEDYPGYYYSSGGSAIDSWWEYTYDDISAETRIISFSTLVRYPSNVFSPFGGIGFSAIKYSYTDDYYYHYEYHNFFNHSLDYEESHADKFQYSKWKYKFFVPLGIYISFPGTGFGITGEVRFFPFAHDKFPKIDRQYRFGLTLAI